MLLKYPLTYLPQNDEQKHWLMPYAAILTLGFPDFSFQFLVVRCGKFHGNSKALRSLQRRRRGDPDSCWIILTAAEIVLGSLSTSRVNPSRMSVDVGIDRMALSTGQSMTNHQWLQCHSRIVIYLWPVEWGCFHFSKRRASRNPHVVLIVMSRWVDLHGIHNLHFSHFEASTN